MKSIKRIISIALCLALVMSYVPIVSLTAFAADGGTTSDGLTWTFDDTTGTLTISGNGAMANYYSSTIPWKAYKSQATDVVIEEGVTSIGKYAFYAFTKMQSVTIPDSVISIGDRAFCVCSKLKSVEISKNVTNIGDYAFMMCKAVTAFTVDSENPVYSNDENGVLFNKDKTVLIAYPAASTSESYTIPDTVTEIYDYGFA